MYVVLGVSCSFLFFVASFVLECFIQEEHSRTKQATKNEREHDTLNTTHVRIRGTHVTTAE
jgi:hypothetical protein